MTERNKFTLEQYSRLRQNLINSIQALQYKKLNEGLNVLIGSKTKGKQFPYIIKFTKKDEIELKELKKSLESLESLT